MKVNVSNVLVIAGLTLLSSNVWAEKWTIDGYGDDVGMRPFITTR